MKKVLNISIVFLAIIVTFSGCVYNGSNDISLFIERYNSLSEKNSKLILQDTQIATNNSGNTFYFFLGENLLLAVTESCDNLLYSCSLCGETKDINASSISSLFTKMIKSFCNFSDDEINDIIHNLGIDTDDSYKKDTKKSYEYKIYSYDFLVNSIGFYISIKYSD